MEKFIQFSTLFLLAPRHQEPDSRQEVGWLVSRETGRVRICNKSAKFKAVSLTERQKPVPAVSIVFSHNERMPMETNTMEEGFVPARGFRGFCHCHLPTDSGVT